jgi:hypothetical protein
LFAEEKFFKIRLSCRRLRQDKLRLSGIFIYQNQLFGDEKK